MIDPHDMSCRELVEVLTEYLDGTLGAHDRARLEAHLSACDDCQAYVAQFRAAITLAGHVDVDGLPAQLRSDLLRVFRSAT